MAVDVNSTFFGEVWRVMPIRPSVCLHQPSPHALLRVNHTIANEWYHDTSISELILNILEILVVGETAMHIGLCIGVLVLRL